MPAAEHVQKGVAEVLGELPVHGAAVQVFMAGESLPDAVRRGRGGAAIDVETAQRIAVGVFAAGGSVVDAAGAIKYFNRRTHPTRRDIRVVVARHLAETVGVHTCKVEDGAHIHVRAEFGAGVGGIGGLMGEDKRVVDALLAAEHVVIEGAIHGATQRLKLHFRLGAAVVRRIHRQRVGGGRQGGAAGAVDVKVAPTICLLYT